MIVGAGEISELQRETGEAVWRALDGAGPRGGPLAAAAVLRPRLRGDVSGGSLRM